jgi:hypothetical protein
VGFPSPCPSVRDLGLGDSSDSPSYRGVVQCNMRMAGWIIKTAHVADLVSPRLERGDPALHKCAGQIVSRQDFPVVRRVLRVLPFRNIPMDGLDFAGERGSVVPVERFGRRAEVKHRQIEEVLFAGVLHVKPRPEPLANGVRSSDTWEDGVSARSYDGCSAGG